MYLTDDIKDSIDNQALASWPIHLIDAGRQSIAERRRTRRWKIEKLVPLDPKQIYPSSELTGIFVEYFEGDEYDISSRVAEIRMSTPPREGRNFRYLAD